MHPGEGVNIRTVVVPLWSGHVRECFVYGADLLLRASGDWYAGAAYGFGAWTVGVTAREHGRVEELDTGKKRSRGRCLE